MTSEQIKQIEIALWHAQDALSYLFSTLNNLLGFRNPMTNRIRIISDTLFNLEPLIEEQISSKL